MFRPVSTKQLVTFVTNLIMILISMIMMKITMMITMKITPLLNPKEVHKNLPSKRPMGMIKGSCELLLFERKLSLKF